MKRYMGMFFRITSRGGRVGWSAANLVALQKVPCSNPSGGAIPDRGGLCDIRRRIPVITVGGMLAGRTYWGGPEKSTSIRGRLRHGILIGHETKYTKYSIGA